VIRDHGQVATAQCVMLDDQRTNALVMVGTELAKKSPAKSEKVLVYEEHASKAFERKNSSD